jgi:hypothetical protein
MHAAAIALSENGFGPAHLSGAGNQFSGPKGSQTTTAGSL